jgi:hypothetical protein
MFASNFKIACFAITITILFSHGQAFSTNSPLICDRACRQKKQQFRIPLTINNCNDRITKNYRTILHASSESKDAFEESLSPETNGESEVQASNQLQVAIVDDNANALRTRESLFNYDSAYVVFCSAIIGILSGFSVAIFKLLIETLREAVYGTSLNEQFYWWLIPALGGVGVSLLTAFGEFSPGLRGTANEIDALSLEVKKDLRFKNVFRFIRKPLAAIITLGSGCSLGPEGPSVEIGMTMSRILMPPSSRRSDLSAEADAAARVRRNRLLLSAGAAAGVAAGFNAPLAGVFFSLEILQQNLPPLTISGTTDGPQSGTPTQPWQQQVQQDYLSSGSGSILAILLASVLSALVSQVYLGEELALSVPSYQLNTPLVELPMVSLGYTHDMTVNHYTILTYRSLDYFCSTFCLE